MPIHSFLQRLIPSTCIHCVWVTVVTESINTMWKDCVSARQEKQAQELKAQGNILFKKGKFIAATEKYTEAITMRPTWAVVYVNRANCYKQLGVWDFVERDCKTAISLEGKSMKAHYFLGLALKERHEHAGAIQHLEISYELASDQGQKLKEEIHKILAFVRYNQWEHQAQCREEHDLKLKHRVSTALKFFHRQELSKCKHSAELAQRHASELESFDNLFNRARMADQKEEIPACYMCPITMQFFSDPVVSPSGFSFERASLVEHINKNGGFDPITRQPISEDQLTPNTDMRSVVKSYLEKNPWAWTEYM